MKLIPLSKQGKNKGKYFAIVDDEDYDYLSQWRWCADVNIYTAYAVRHSGGIKIYLHRFIMKTANDKFCDHRDKHGLNCQKSNLRNCTPFQNAVNKTSRRNSSSQYLGVSFYKKDGVWEARIGVDYKQIYLGRYKKESEAAKAYDHKAKELFGKFANLNFK